MYLLRLYSNDSWLKLMLIQQKKNVSNSQLKFVRIQEKNKKASVLQ